MKSLKQRLRIGMLVLGLTTAHSALSAESATDAAAQRCAAIESMSERLACFDRVFPHRAADSARPAAPRAVAPVNGPSPAIAPASAPVVTSSPVTAEQRFGDDSLRRDQRRDPEPEVRTISATITALKESRRNVWRISLDNGQTWQQEDLSSAFAPKVGQKIKFERGRMGGYFMSLDEGGRAVWVRATRMR